MSEGYKPPVLAPRNPRLRCYEIKWEVPENHQSREFAEETLGAVRDALVQAQQENDLGARAPSPAQVDRVTEWTRHFWDLFTGR